MIRPISKPQAHRLQAGDDRVKVHTRYRTIIPGWQLRTGLICCWHATPAVCQHKDTGALPDKNCHRHQRVCCFCCFRMEQLTPQLRMLSCSVQAFARRLKKHLFISCYERIWRFFILRYTNILIIIIIISINIITNHSSENTQVKWSGARLTAVSVLHDAQLLAE